jgi:hypothetical protein
MNNLRMRKRMCVLVSKIKKQELGCLLFRLLARVCVLACLWLRLGLCLHGARVCVLACVWLRLGLCLHGAAYVPLFAWCVPPCLHGAASVSLFAWCVPPFFSPPPLSRLRSVHPILFFVSGGEKNCFMYIQSQKHVGLSSVTSKLF